MIRAMLADRFKLAAHNESRELPIYELVKARSDGKLGPQLHPAAVDCAALAAARGRGGAPPPGGPGDFNRGGGRRSWSGRAGSGRTRFRSRRPATLRHLHGTSESCGRQPKPGATRDDLVGACRADGCGSVPVSPGPLIWI